MLDKLTEAVIKWTFFLASTFHQIDMPDLPYLILWSDLFYFWDMCLLLKKLSDKVFVLERAVIQRFNKIFPINIFKNWHLVQFGIVQLFQFASKSLS